MRKKILGIFDRRPLIWFHYVLLTGVLFGGFFAASWLNLVTVNTELSAQKWAILFVWYYIFISIGDQFIHKILKVD